MLESGQILSQGQKSCISILKNQFLSDINTHPRSPQYNFLGLAGLKVDYI